MNELQNHIMSVVEGWVHTHKKPTPLKLILKGVDENRQRTVRASVDSLCRKGYLRKSCVRGLASYVKLRGI